MRTNQRHRRLRPRILFELPGCFENLEIGGQRHVDDGAGALPRVRSRLLRPDLRRGTLHEQLGDRFIPIRVVQSVVQRANLLPYPRPLRRVRYLHLERRMLLNRIEVVIQRAFVMLGGIQLASELQRAVEPNEFRVLLNRSRRSESVDHFFLKLLQLGRYRPQRRRTSLSREFQRGAEVCERRSALRRAQIIESKPSIALSRVRMRGVEHRDRLALRALGQSSYHRRNVRRWRGVSIEILERDCGLRPLPFKARHPFLNRLLIVADRLDPIQDDSCPAQLFQAEIVPARLESIAGVADERFDQVLRVFQVRIGVGHGAQLSLNPRGFALQRRPELVCGG